jgi:hypothetical protein
VRLLLGIPIDAGVCAALAKNPPYLLVSGLMAAPSVLLTWYWRDAKRRADTRIAQESAIASRYRAAGELIGNEKSMSRITGLFALSDVAQESADHRATVARTFAAYLRTANGDEPQAAPSPEGYLGVAIDADADEQAVMQPPRTYKSRPH